jgi:hypothetical protein
VQILACSMGANESNSEASSEHMNSVKNMSHYDPTTYLSVARLNLTHRTIDVVLVSEPEDVDSKMHANGAVDDR